MRRPVFTLSGARWCGCPRHGLALALLCGLSLAAPRIGQHDGFIRLVFTLPGTTTQRTTTGQTDHHHAEAATGR